MKIALSNVPTAEDIARFYPNVSLLYLASYLKKYCKKKIEIRYFEANGNLTEYIKKIRDFNPDIIAFPVVHPTLSAFKSIAKQLDCLIIVGGNYPTYDQSVFKGYADICILGEGEETFSEIVDRYSGSLADLANVRGIAYFNEGKTIVTPPRPLIKSLDDIPYPSHDLINIKDYTGYVFQKNKPDMYILTSRGCPHKCIFCSNPVWRMAQQKVRTRSPGNIAGEVSMLYSRYGVREIYDYSDYFNMDLPWTKKVCDSIIKLNLKGLAFKCQLRVDNVDEELAQKLRKMGTWFVHFGIESANQRTLDGIKKRITIEQVKRSCNIMRKYGIKVGGFFMLFNFWEEHGCLEFEDVADSEKTLRFARDLLSKDMINYVSLGFTIPMPGSENYEVAMRHNLIKRTHEQYNVENYLLNIPGVDKTEAFRLKNKGLMLQAYSGLKNGNINLFSTHIGLKIKSMINNLYRSF